MTQSSKLKIKAQSEIHMDRKNPTGKLIRTNPFHEYPAEADQINSSIKMIHELDK